jgi:hypothetical protein
VFQASTIGQRDVPVSSIFYYALRGTKYMPKSTKARYTQKLYDDMKNFFTNLEVDVASYSQVQKVLLGYRNYDFSVVCQIAFFLGVSVEDLIFSRLTDRDIAMEQQSHYMQGKEVINWNALDKEMSLRLKKLAYHTYYGDSVNRPSKVSERFVYEKLNLNAHSLSKMPTCKRILKRYEESYDDLWARRLIWAYRKLISERKEKLFWCDIRKLSGVKKKHIPTITPKLSKYGGIEEVNAILSLVSL